MSVYIKGKLDNTCSYKSFSLTSVLDKDMLFPTSLKELKQLYGIEDENMAFKSNSTSSFSAITKLVHNAQSFSNIPRFLSKHLTWYHITKAQNHHSRHYLD